MRKSAAVLAIAALGTMMTSVQRLNRWRADMTGVKVMAGLVDMKSSGIIMDLPAIMGSGAMTATSGMASTEGISGTLGTRIITGATLTIPAGSRFSSAAAILTTAGNCRGQSGIIIP